MRDADVHACLTAALEAEWPESPSSLSATWGQDALELLPTRMRSPYAATLGPCVSARMRAWNVPAGTPFPREAVLLHLRPEGTPAPDAGGCATLGEAHVEGQHLTVLHGPIEHMSSSPFFHPDAERALHALKRQRVLAFTAQVTAQGQIESVVWEGHEEALHIARPALLKGSLLPNQACGLPIDSVLQLTFAYGGRGR